MRTTVSKYQRQMLQAAIASLQLWRLPQIPWAAPGRWVKDGRCDWNRHASAWSSAGEDRVQVTCEAKKISSPKRTQDKLRRNWKGSIVWSCLAALGDSDFCSPSWNYSQGMQMTCYDSIWLPRIHTKTPPEATRSSHFFKQEWARRAQKDQSC